MTEEEMKAWIDSASYEELLRRWRFAPIGSPWFLGEVGKHFSNVMMDRRREVGDLEHTRISKIIGWN